MLSNLKISQTFKTKTIRHFLITSSGTMLNGLLGLLFYITSARFLGPDIFGLLSICIATITLISDMADLGVDTGIIRFVGKFRIENKETALKFLKLGLEFKLVIWLIILIAGWIFAPFVAGNVFLKPELTNPLRLAEIGIGGAMIFSLTTHALQAYEKYWAWSLLNIAMNSLRLVVVLIFVLASNLNLELTLLTYIIVPFLGFFIALLLLPDFLAVKNEISIKKDLFHYSKWVALISILTALSSRLDIFISARLLSTTQVGIYGAANQMTIFIPQLIFALATVVAPKLASFDTAAKAFEYFKKLQLLVIGLFVAGIVLIPVLILLIPLFYGGAYQESINPFIILFIAQLIFLLSLPAHQVIYYYFARPTILSITAIGQILIMSIGGWWLIISFGVVGAAGAILLSNLFNFIIPLLFVLNNFRLQTIKQ